MSEYTVDELKQKIQEIKYKVLQNNYKHPESVTEAIVDAWEIVTKDVEKIGYESVKLQGEQSVQDIENKRTQFLQETKTEIDDYIEQKSKPEIDNYVVHMTTSSDGAVTAERNARISADNELQNNINNITNTELPKYLLKSGGDISGTVRITSNSTSIMLKGINKDDENELNRYRDISCVDVNNIRTGVLRSIHDEYGTRSIQLNVCSDTNKNLGGLGVNCRQGTETVDITASQHPPEKVYDNHLTTAKWVKSEMLNIVYPIGSIYMSVNNVSPQTFLGGTWEKLENRMLIGASSTYAVNSTGGSTTNTLTVAQLPSHTHTATASSESAGSHNHDRGNMNITGYAGFVDNDTASYKIKSSGASGAFYTKSISGNPFNSNSIGSSTFNEGGYFDASKNNAWTGNTNSTGSHTHTITVTNSNTGSGDSINNMPPYLAVYMWKRTA